MRGSHAPPQAERHGRQPNWVTAEFLARGPDAPQKVAAIQCAVLVRGFSPATVPECGEDEHGNGGAGYWMRGAVNGSTVMLPFLDPTHRDECYVSAMYGSVRYLLVVGAIVASGCEADRDAPASTDARPGADGRNRVTDARTGQNNADGAAGNADGAAGNPDGSTGNVDANAGTQLDSTLVSSCATLRGRALVNYNGNLGIAFTEDDLPYSSIGTIQFELPSGFVGTVPNPEQWDGVSPRQLVAVTSAGFELHGSHCWFEDTPPTGTATITEYRPTDGVVRASFSNFPVHSCIGPSVCTVSGTVETTGEGVFE